MLLRNPELRLLCLVLLLITCIFCAVALSVAGEAAAAAVLACALSLCAAFALATRARYRAIARLSEQLDQRLHGERDLALGDAREGELAVLVNEIDKLLQRLTVTADELGRERALLADSLADISHQLRTPLTSLSIMTELVRRRVAECDGALSDADAADVAERLRAIERLEERVSWLVEALLKLARADAGAIALEHGRVDAAELVRRATEPLAISFELANVELEVDVQPGAGYLGDLAWSVEALQNVLKNSLEHTPAGGCVRVAAAEDALACRITVTDTGPGIADEDLPHIFERFYRGRGSDVAPREGVPAGVGIGLALARGLVNAQDGRITARNVADPAGGVAGACFEIAFFKTVV